MQNSNVWRAMRVSRKHAWCSGSLGNLPGKRACRSNASRSLTEPRDSSLRGDVERQRLRFTISTKRGERTVLLLGHADEIAEMAQFHTRLSRLIRRVRAIPK